MAPRNPVDVLPSSVEEELPEGMTGPGNAVDGRDVKQVPTQIVWRNVMYFILLHLGALYGLYLLPYAMPATWAWTAIAYVMNALGITAGAHRLWSHRAYRARLPLRIVLAILNSMAFQNDIIEWSRDHRMHHKYSETMADPHNANRGFFFSHCGWLMCRKHPEVKEKGKQIDMSDLLNDPVCAMQRKFYLPSVVLFCFVLPTVIPVYFWGESAWNAYFICAMLRYIAALNVTWTVNSVAHLWGNRPYDWRISPVENIFVTMSACGEGFHNYHHVFPSDYSTSEHGWKINMTTVFIDCMSALGLVTERKKMSREAVKRRMERSGDGSTDFGF
jgi:stearoyl-CoA desaturase (delta-9 desaturase)